jgi:membrane protease YdiL (CAAX protease family)
MVLYIGSMLGIGALTARLDWEVGRWTAPLAAQALSLAALLWPVVRGVRFSDVRRDVGISLPSYAWLEPFRGIAAYALSLPILMVGVMCTIMLIQLQALFTGAGDPFTTPNVPAHPIIESVDDHNPWIFWQILLLAAVGAPIVEEIMFRGVLYRSLRDSTRGLRAAGSVAASMAISGFLFAVIHPQGWVAIPALGALATGFAIAREWRGTIWPSVIAHGINNGLVTVLLFSMFGGS